VSVTSPPAVRRLTPEMLDEVVRIHLAGMGYTLNAQLGEDHLKYLYLSMTADPECYAGVAHVDGAPVGVVSGAIDGARLSSRLLREMPATRQVRTGIQMALRPSMIRLWLQGNSIARPVSTESGEVRAVLTAIVVAPGVQGRGIGRALVAAFEGFLREAGVPAYRLDTQIRNARAMQFYHDLGFAEVARRADSIILVRNLQT
jgi:ribosomal protein S18 acetylase RimI-like enzyme